MCSRMPSLLLLLLLLLLTIRLLLLTTACGRESPPPTAQEVLSIMLTTMRRTVQTLPEGLVRLSAAPSDAPEHLSPVLLSSLYGEVMGELMGEEGEDVPPLGDVALYLSLSPYPCELGVFRCVDEETAREVATLCRSRLATLRRGFGLEAEGDHEGGGQPDENGWVLREGRWVLLILCEDPRPVAEAVRRRIG